MAAKDNISGSQFFHGSAAELQPGDIIRPGAEVGQRNSPHLKSWRANHVWMTNDIQTAHKWADLGTHDPTATHAYEVEPLEEPKRRRKLDSYTGGAEFTTSAARVVREHPRHQQGYLNTHTIRWPSGKQEMSPFATGYSNTIHNHDDRNFS